MVPAIVTRSGNDILPLRASSDSAANRISGYRSTCSTSVRIDSVTFLISSVSGGVSTSRLSVGSVRRSEEAARPGR